MPLGKHSRTEKGTFRRERGDAKAGTLRQDYPEFSKVRADAQLQNIKKILGLPVDASINMVRKLFGISNPTRLGLLWQRCIFSASLNPTAKGEIKCALSV